MKETRPLMGMPITVEIADASGTHAAIAKVFDYFDYVDQTFSTYKVASEITRINNGEITPENFSADMKVVFALAEKTKIESGGYFDIKTPAGSLDPSGIVKGWAILNAARLLHESGYKNFYVEAGGDIEAHGKNSEGKKWRVGIRNPFDTKEIVKAIEITGVGVATSCNYERGAHIYNPKHGGEAAKDIVSLTVIGPDICEADRFATAAFAMGAAGIQFIEQLPGFESYMIDAKGMGTMTAGFERYIIKT